MKRFLSLILLITFVLSFSACNGTATSSEPFGSAYVETFEEIIESDEEGEDNQEDSKGQSSSKKKTASSEGQSSSKKKDSSKVSSSKQSSNKTESNKTSSSVSSSSSSLDTTTPSVQGNIVNVKDFGAKGDGITDDKEAILAAFKDAIKNLPATVYFPKGEYTIYNGGMYIKLPLGAQGLTVTGAGADKSTIKYAQDWTTNGSWVALRIQPKSTPSTEAEYLKNITIKDLGVYDTNPVDHAWNTNKGDKATEETHGFDIQYCIGATIKNCKVDSVGDEAIDMVYCIDSTIANNTVLNSPGAGSSGGAISVGDGCKNVTIINSTVDGSIGGKTNFGIAVEALVEPVSQVSIINNTIKNINGNAINIASPGNTIDSVTTFNNRITNCINGVHFYGTHKKTNIRIEKNYINLIRRAFLIEGSNAGDFVIDGFEADRVLTRGIHINSGVNAIIKNGTFSNLDNDAIWNAGENTLVQNVLIDGVGLASNSSPAISQYVPSGSCSLQDVTIKNCQNKTAIKNIVSLTNVTVEQPQTAGYYSVQGASKIIGGSFNRNIIGLKEGAVIDGATVAITANMGSTPAIYLTVSNCIVKNCTITVPSGRAIAEGGSANFNQVLNNTCIGGSVLKLGENSVFSGNVIK